MAHDSFDSARPYVVWIHIEDQTEDDSADWSDVDPGTAETARFATEDEAQTFTAIMHSLGIDGMRTKTENDGALPIPTCDGGQVP